MFRSRIKWRCSKHKRPQWKSSGGTPSMCAHGSSSGGTANGSAPSPSSGSTAASSAPSSTSSGSGRTFRCVPIQDNDTSGCEWQLFRSDASGGELTKPCMNASRRGMRKPCPKLCAVPAGLAEALPIFCRDSHWIRVSLPFHNAAFVVVLEEPLPCLQNERQMIRR